MQLLLPIRSIDQVRNYLDAGIREFYCGYISKDWINHFNKKHESQWVTLQVSTNRRDYLTSNYIDLEELKKSAELCKKFGASLFITLNAAFYPEMAYDHLEKWLCEIEYAGITHIIISDIGVMNYVFKYHSHLKITVSCENQVLNKYAVSFYKRFNPERIVFPRHITVEEMGEIMKKFPHIEFESFLLSSRCIFDDGNCRCIHDIEPICNEAWIMKFYRSDGIDITTSENRELKIANQDFIDWTHGIEQSKYHGFGCGKILCSICSVYSLAKYPNFSSLKVVGRGMKFPKENLDSFKEIISLSERNEPLLEYQKLARKFLGYDSLCENTLFCNMKGAL